MGGGRKATGKATVDATESNSVIIAYPAISLARYMANRKKKEGKYEKITQHWLRNRAPKTNERAARERTKNRFAPSQSISSRCALATRNASRRSVMLERCIPRCNRINTDDYQRWTTDWNFVEAYRPRGGRKSGITDITYVYILRA